MMGKTPAAAGLVCLVLAFVAAGCLFPPRAAGIPLPELAPAPVETASPPPPVWDEGVVPESASIRLLLPDGTVEALPMEDYVVRVLCAEMPASFESAALEAQAVCARTYALRRRGSGLHAPMADVCADSACCQGYAAAPPESWGADTETYTRKLQAAVRATAGQVLTQDGQLIDAVFHASSAGFTAPAQAVWGAAVPYLVSVSTPETVETVEGLREERAFTPEELSALLGPGELGAVTYGDWGGVETLSVGDRLLSGPEVRQRLGLRSARFSVDRRDGLVVFTTVGYGHGVGMSQHGANLMARDGASYGDILAHYYPGTALETRQ